MSDQKPQTRTLSTTSTRADYRYFQKLGTRWKDNDIYGHVNNVEYYSFFDTVINKWLIEEGGLDIHTGSVIGVCAESNCRFLKSIAFPDTIEAGLRIAHLGRTSVRYEIGLLNESSKEMIAEGWFVHVFVSRANRQPEQIPDNLRKAMTAITVTTV